LINDALKDTLSSFTVPPETRCQRFLSNYLEPDYTQVFRLQEELPAPLNDDERELIQKLDQLAQKVKQIQTLGYQLSSAELDPIYELCAEVENVPMAASILGFIFMMLGEHAAMYKVFNRAIEIHGTIPALVFYAALALKKMQRNSSALELLQRLIGAGAKHYLIFMMAAELQFELDQHRPCIAMCNLAVYENVEEKVEPFLLMARCFEHLGETERLFECFSRVEKMRGPLALQRELGGLYSDYGEMYEKVKSMIGNQHG